MSYEPSFLDKPDLSLSLAEEEQLEIEAAEAFLQAEPEYAERYASDLNRDLLKGWIFSRNGCISLANLQYAFRALVAEGVMKPTPAEVATVAVEVEETSVPTRQRLYGVKTLNMAEQQLANEISPTPEVDNSINNHERTMFSGQSWKNVKRIGIGSAEDKKRAAEIDELKKASDKQRIGARSEAQKLRHRQGLI